ncbi:MAG: choice-of-anchor D domain-containing protein [Candidatus Dadabacteria bacterium]|nr:MAG: choice-of-anchor D domain-containing protein [Candidatus Dadabacteria bacterium]
MTTETSAAVVQPCPPLVPPAPSGPQISVRSDAGSNTTDQTTFGTVPIGSAATSTVLVSNSGDQNLTIGSVAVNDGLAAPFSVSADTCSSNTLQAGERCTVTVSFAPAATGTYSDQFDIPSNDPTATLTLWRVDGVGAAPGNNPPPAPRLIAPDDEAEIAGTSVEFIWASDPDPDGDPLTFELTYCTATDFTGCVPVEVTLPRETEQSKSTSDALEWSLLLGMGAVLVPLRRNLLAVTLIIALGAGVACNEKGLFEISLGKNEVAYGFLATDLEPGSTYVWKVEALDGNGGRTPSETRTFTVK